MILSGSRGPLVRHEAALAAERSYLTRFRHSPAECDYNHDQCGWQAYGASQWRVWSPKDRCVCSSEYCHCGAGRIFHGLGVGSGHRRIRSHIDISLKNYKLEEHEVEHPVSYMQNAQYDPQPTHDADVHPGKYIAHHISLRSQRRVTRGKEIVQAF